MESTAPLRQRGIHELVEVVLARALHDEEEVDEPPHAKPSAGEELEDAEPHLADVDAVDAVGSQEDREHQRDGGVLELGEQHVGHWIVELFEALFYHGEGGRRQFAAVDHEQLVGLVGIHSFDEVWYEVKCPAGFSPRAR